MSTPLDQKGPAQPTKVDRKDGPANGQPEAGKSEQAQKDDKVLPGADGDSSAGANEDTYD